MTLLACGLWLLLGSSPLIAQEASPKAAPEPVSDLNLTPPRLTTPTIDWDAARAALTRLDQAAPEESEGNAGADGLARLNKGTAKIFANIDASAIPVLLPFDTASYLRDAAQGAANDASKYLAGSAAPSFFFAGPSGYDAALSLPSQSLAGLGLTFANRVDLQISGSAVLYELGPEALFEERAVPALDGDFPGIRRVLLEEHLRYTFTRFGALYVVAMECFDGAASAHRLSCREADKVALLVLKALNLVGGSPRPIATDATRATIERPSSVSPDFTYYAPGDLIPGSGMKGQSGRADATVYANIRFPIAHAPAYANSQSFMNWGNCDFTGRTALSGEGRTATYRCKVNSIPLVHDESKNYAYPWRDNFCEHRYFYVGQCPSGLGHQGQDIRPGACALRNDGADRCEPYQEEVVAVHDGMLLRAPGDKALYLMVDSPGEHIRFRYLHMNPQMLDAAGMVSGRAVAEGEVIGTVGNFGRHAGGTSYHLHFDMQVLTRDGWAFASPYMTLVTAYERLIGGRGRMVRDPAPVAPSSPAAADAAAPIATAAATAPAAKPETKPETKSAVLAPAKSEPHRERQAARPASCAIRVIKGHRRRVCGTESEASDARKKHRGRSVDRREPRQSHGARHHDGHVEPRHARSSARHDGA